MESPSKYLLILVLLMPLWNKVAASSKIFPYEGAKLNYRIIGFSFPANVLCRNYRVEIANGVISDPAHFSASISIPTDSNRAIAEVPQFGADYTWRVAYMAGNKPVYSELFHFFVQPIPGPKSNTRLRVTKSNHKYNDHFLLIDNTATMYDMQGNPIWFIPNYDSSLFMLNIPASFDMKPTPQHSITVISGKDAFDIDYSGQILWRTSGAAPASHPEASPLMIHHDFTRLANGHYMGIVTQLLSNKGQPDNNQDDRNTKRFFQNTHGQTMLCELDSAGNTLWTWNSQEYLMNSDIAPLLTYIKEKWGTEFCNSHENAFYFDEKNQVIYVSYVTYNRIVEISYPSGKVIHTFGKRYDPSLGEKLFATCKVLPTGIDTFLQYELFDNGIYVGQHDCKLNNDGNIVLYNNMYGTDKLPSVIVLKENKINGELEKDWEFICPKNNTDMYRNNGGGSVSEIAGNDLLVSMNLPNGRIFIVNERKQITWDAIPEMTETNGNWHTSSPYRVSVLDKAELEKMIWKSEASYLSDTPPAITFFSTN